MRKNRALWRKIGQIVLNVTFFRVELAGRIRYHQKGLVKAVSMVRYLTFYLDDGQNDSGWDNHRKSDFWAKYVSECATCHFFHGWGRNSNRAPVKRLWRELFNGTLFDLLAQLWRKLRSARFGQNSSIVSLFSSFIPLCLVRLIWQFSSKPRAIPAKVHCTPTLDFSW